MFCGWLIEGFFGLLRIDEVLYNGEYSFIKKIIEIRLLNLLIN